MSSSLILHDIRVLFLGQDTSRIIVSSQCCTVMCFGFESLSYHHIVALSSLQSDTCCVIPLLPCKRGNTKRGMLVSVWAREGIVWSEVKGNLSDRKTLMFSVVNETAACDLSVLVAFPVSLLTDTLFGSRLWQHLWKTTQSTWFHQCSRSCPSSGTPWRKVLLYILGSEWIWMGLTGIEWDKLSLIPTNDLTAGEAKYMECSALPDKTGSFCYFRRLH